MESRVRRQVEKRLDMSRHEGVSCDACTKSNFKGQRMKCLRCYDYDLCANCHELGAATSRHTPDHPVQCILSRADFDLYYNGETNPELSYSLTCPICGKLGLTESELQTHVASEHQNCNTEVVCSICASIPGGEPNLVTDDFASHLAIEHRSQQTARDEDVGSSRPNLRRVQQQPSRTLGVGRGRRPNMHFGSGGLSPSSGGGVGGVGGGPSRDSVDPIAELLSQLSGVRRAAAVPYDRLLHPRHAGGVGAGNSQNQLQSFTTGQQQGGSGGGTGTAKRSVFPPHPLATSGQAIMLNEAAIAAGLSAQGILGAETGHVSGGGGREKRQFLLDKYLDSQRRKDLNPEQSLFLQDLTLATMTMCLDNNKTSTSTAAAATTSSSSASSSLCQS